MKHKSCRVSFSAAYLLQSLLAFLLAMSLAPLTFSGDDWVLVTDKEKIQLYTRPVAGSPFLEVKAVAIIRASIERVTEVFGDGETCAAWRHSCKSSRLLRKPAENELYIHMVLDLPWPVSDRDMVVRSIKSADEVNQIVTLAIDSVAGEYPPEDYVRAKTTAHYAFQSHDLGEVSLTYIAHIDLGGDLSSAMVNSQLASSTFDDLKRLVALAEG